MQNAVNSFVNDVSKKNGLLLIDLSTGYGKTYMAARSIFQYLKENKGVEEQFEKDVLVIRSNFDFVCENLLNLEIPETYRTQAYQNLTINDTEKEGREDSFYKNNKNYQWIGKLYPIVFMDEYKVYMLTMSKFLVKNTTLVEPACHRYAE